MERPEAIEHLKSKPDLPFIVRINKEGQHCVSARLKNGELVHTIIKTLPNGSFSVLRQGAPPITASSIQHALELLGYLKPLPPQADVDSDYSAAVSAAELDFQAKEKHKNTRKKKAKGAEANSKSDRKPRKPKHAHVQKVYSGPPHLGMPDNGAVGADDDSSSFETEEEDDVDLANHPGNMPSEDYVAIMPGRAMTTRAAQDDYVVVADSRSFAQLSAGTRSESPGQRSASPSSMPGHYVGLPIAPNARNSPHMFANQPGRSVQAVPPARATQGSGIYQPAPSVARIGGLLPVARTKR